MRVSAKKARDDASFADPTSYRVLPLRRCQYFLVAVIQFVVFCFFPVTRKGKRAAGGVFRGISTILSQDE